MTIATLLLATFAPCPVGGWVSPGSIGPAGSTGPAGRTGPPVASEDLRPWTLMVYGAADNNADGPILEFLDGVRKALDDDPGMELILFIDRSTEYSDDADVLGADFTGARLFRLTSETAEPLEAGEFFPGMDEGGEYEVDSSDPGNIERFVAFGKQHFPARRYGLMIYSHANGCTMCPDDESGGDMHIPELTEVVGPEASVDFLALELCNMGGIEIAYQWRPGNGGFSTDALLAIPTAGPPLDWDRAFARIRSDGHAAFAGAETVDPEGMDALGFGRLVVEEGFEGRRAVAKAHPEFAAQVAYESAACYDLARSAEAKRSVDKLAAALAVHGSREVLEELRGPGPEGAVMNYVGGEFGRRPYVDLPALLTRIADCDELAPEVRAAAREARVAVDELVVASFGMPGHEGFVAGENGIFIVFPSSRDLIDGPMGERPAWPELDWYTPLEPLEPDGPYGRWSFLAEGATPDNGEVENWFELLDCWFDDVSLDPGGVNHYVY